MKKLPRILLEVDLEPRQGSRFQPTGFPNLGAATYNIPDEKSTRALLVESTQSMANRFERICLKNENDDELVDELSGMPFVSVTGSDEKTITNSLLESHRLASAYITEGGDDTIMERIKNELGIQDKKSPVTQEVLQKLYYFLFRIDPNSLLHGVFFAKSDLVGGRLKVPRALSAFIEAEGVNDVISGGAKIDNVDPSGGDEGAEKGFGNVPFPRVEYTASKITAYFNLNITQILSYNLKEIETEFLICMALWKIRRFLDDGLKLRTACDLVQKGEIKTEHDGFALPNSDKLGKEIKALIQKCEFGDPITITYRKKKSKNSDQ